MLVGGFIVFNGWQLVAPLLSLSFELSLSLYFSLALPLLS